MRTHTIVIGGGQAGLATSAALAERGIDHVVLERGRVANAWRTERWDSLRLLSPNWMTRLPGFRYDGPDPDGYMTVSDLVSFLQRFAVHIDAPVEEQTAVCAVRRTADGFEVATDRGVWTADAVVVATGATARPFVPRLAAALPSGLAQFTTATYKRPGQLPHGNVLVVGASASGAQLASELQASGRDVVLAVGRHARLPRRYRGADIMTWFERSGIFGDRADRVQDLAAARRQPSLQLIGSTPPRDLDLNALQDEGVRLAGRLAGIDGARLSFADDLPASIADADAKLADVLARIAPVADAVGAPSAQPIARIRMPVAPTTLDIFAERITSVVWATGFRRSYPWLHVPVIDQHGDIRQRAGVTSVPGLYTIGMRFQRRRRSNFIDGVGDDAQFLARYIAAHDRVRALA